MSPDITPEELENMRGYQANPDRARQEWVDGQGSRWADRNPIAPAASDESFQRRYGVLKSYALRDALRGVPRTTDWLEVGCSTCAHMALLRSLGFSGLIGTDLSLGALQRACEPLVLQSDVLNLPFRDGAVEGITTAGTLMHMGPEPRLVDSILEMGRVARRYLFSAELSSESAQIISFGELLPPAWLYPWDLALQEVLGAGWVLRYHVTYELLPGLGTLSAPMKVTLFERVS